MKYHKVPEEDLLNYTVKVTVICYDQVIIEMYVQHQHSRPQLLSQKLFSSHSQIISYQGIENSRKDILLFWHSVKQKM